MYIYVSTEFPKELPHKNKRNVRFFKKYRYGWEKNIEKVKKNKKWEDELLCLSFFYK